VGVFYVNFVNKRIGYINMGSPFLAIYIMSQGNKEEFLEGDCIIF
jgi:hypothetical protein